jgi:hypothetical protein
MPYTRDEFLKKARAAGLASDEELFNAITRYRDRYGNFAGEDKKELGLKEKAGAIVRGTVLGAGESIPVLGKKLVSGPLESRRKLREETEPEKLELEEKARAISKPLHQALQSIGLSVASFGAGATSLPGTLAGRLAAGFEAGAASSLPYAPDKENREEVVEEILTGSAIGLGFGAAGKIYAGLKDLAGRAGSQIARDASRIPKEVRKVYGFLGTGRDMNMVKLAAGKGREISDEVVSVLDDNKTFISLMGKKAAESLDNARPVDISPVIAELDAAMPKTGVVPGEAERAITDLKATIDNFRKRSLGIAPGQERKITLPPGVEGGTGKIKARELLDIRKEIDNSLDKVYSGKTEFSDYYVRGLNQANKKIRELLVASGEGTGYEKTMKEMAEKLNAIGEIREYVRGNTDLKIRGSAERFISSIGKASTTKDKEQLLANIDRVFGKDLGERVKYLSFAKHLVDEETGKPFLLGKEKGLGRITGSLPVISAVESGAGLADRLKRLVTPGMLAQRKPMKPVEPAEEE